MDLKSKLLDKKMGKAPEPKTEMSLDEALSLLRTTDTQEKTSGPEGKLPEQEGLKDTPDEDDGLSPKGGLVGRIIRSIVNPGPIQKHNNQLREAQAALVRG